MRHLFALIAFALFLGAAFAPRPALAHAVLLGTEPAADAVLAEGLDRIVLSFNEPVRPVVLRLIDAEGGVIADTVAARAVDHRVELPLDETLPEGGYIVTWRVISADSHPVGGSFRFGVGSLPATWQGGEQPRLEKTDTRFWSIGLGAARSLYLAGLLLAAGGAWFALLVDRGRSGLDKPVGVIIRLGALGGAAAAFAGIGLQGGLLVGAAPVEYFSVSLWTAGLSTPIGQALLASSLLLVLLAALAGYVSRPTAAVVALLAVLPLGLAGHVAVAEPRWLTGPSLMLHAVLAAFWFGSLPPLLLAVRRLPGGDAALLLERFSRLGVAAVALLVAAGTVMTAIQLASLSAFWETAYGMVLGAKLVLVAGLMLIALANRMALTPRLAAGAPGAARRLSRNISVEIALIGAILALTASLGFNTPPRALQAMETHHSHDHRHDHGHHHGHDHDHDHGHGQPTIEREATVAGVTTTLRLSPGRAGLNRLHVWIEDADGNRIEPLEVEARFSSAEHGIEPVVRRIAQDGDDFVLETSDMALPGLWQIRLDVLVTDFDKPVFEFEVRVW